MERDTLTAPRSTTNLPDGLLAIRQLNLEKVLAKLQKPAPRGRGWTPAEVVAADKWYRRFLTIALKNPNVVLVPNEAVDELWHAHILDMQKYEDDTTRIFGQVLYHRPTFCEVDLRPQFAVTNKLLEAEFGESLATTNDYEPASCCCVDVPVVQQ